MGLRQLGHPLQGLRPAGRPDAPRRRSRTRQPCTGITGLAPSVALHIPWDKVDDFDKLRRHAEDLGIRLGTINSNTFQDDDYKFGSLCHVDQRVRAKAIDHIFECIDIMGATGARPQDLAGRRHRTTRGRATCGAARTAWPTRSPGLRPPRRRTSDWCSSTSSSSRRSTTPTSPTGAPRTRSASRSGARRGLPRHRPSRPGNEHRVHRDAAAAAGEARLVRLQLALLRRRRPDRRRGRPVPAVPHPLRGRPRRRLRRRRAASCSCSTSATTSRRRSPARSAPCSTCRR